MADRQFISAHQIRNDPLPAGWEMKIDNTSGVPYFIDHNSKNTTWNDPRVMMDQYQYSYPSYSRPAAPAGRVVEVPIRFEGWNPNQPQQHHHNTSYSHPNHHPGVPPQGSHNEPMNQNQHSANMPRKRGDVWEIPIQHVGSGGGASSNHPQQHAYPQSSQFNQQGQPHAHPHQGQPHAYSHPQQGQPHAYPHQSHHQATPHGYQQYLPTASVDYSTLHQPGGKANQNPSENYPRGPVTIPIIRETCSSPNPARASPNPMAGPQSSPRASPKPDFSQAVPPSVQHQMFQNQSQQEPIPDYNNESPQMPPTHPIPAPAPEPRQQVEQSPPQPPKSQEERAFELINGIMSEVKSLEEQVNNFKGVKKDKDYKLIEEMLTRSQLKLDSVDSGSNENVRQARKQAVRYIEAALDLLELKAVASEATYNPRKAPDPNQDPNGQANTNNSTCANRSSSNGQISSAGAPQMQESSSKDLSRIKEMQLDSEIPC